MSGWGDNKRQRYGDPGSYRGGRAGGGSRSRGGGRGGDGNRGVDQKGYYGSDGNDEEYYTYRGGGRGAVSAAAAAGGGNYRDNQEEYHVRRDGLDQRVGGLDRKHNEDNYYDGLRSSSRQRHSTGDGGDYHGNRRDRGNDNSYNSEQYESISRGASRGGSYNEGVFGGQQQGYDESFQYPGVGASDDRSGERGRGYDDLRRGGASGGGGRGFRGRPQRGGSAFANRGSRGDGGRGGAPFQRQSQQVRYRGDGPRGDDFRGGRGGYRRNRGPPRGSFDDWGGDSRGRGRVGRGAFSGDSVCEVSYRGRFGGLFADRGRGEYAGRLLDRGGRGDGRASSGRGGRGREKVPREAVQSVITNLIPAKVSNNFSFVFYTLDVVDAKGQQVESRSFRRILFRSGLDLIHADIPEKNRKDLERTIFFTGAGFFAARPLERLEAKELPYEFFRSEEGDTMKVMQAFHYRAPEELGTKDFEFEHDEHAVVADTFRCGKCSSTFNNRDALMHHIQDSGHSLVYEPPTDAIPAPTDVFIAYVNLALSAAMGERLARWGQEFVDPTSEQPAKDKKNNELGVNIFRAYSCKFNLYKGDDGHARLMLICDLRAKIIRTKSVLDAIYDGPGGKRKPGSYQLTDRDKKTAESQLVGEVIIYKTEKKCYTVIGVDFEHSPATLPVPGKDMSHAEYFTNTKGINLDYPSVPPMIAVLGRRKQPIHLPAELVMANELDSRVREMLPTIASFNPKVRSEAIQKVKDFLIPGAQKTKGAGGLLPSIGIVLEAAALQSPAEVLSVPTLVVAGHEVPKDLAENWAPVLNRANFDVDPNDSVELKVILFYSSWVKGGANQVYYKIQSFVNSFKATYRISEQPHVAIEIDTAENHWQAVECYFSSPDVPNNVFVIDFVKPRGTQDPAYPVVKRLLSKSGYLSQFVNFKTYDHEKPSERRRSDITLQGVARQILSKAGARLWWVKIPKEIPLPAVFVGVDVFHAPMVYDPQSKERTRKSSCAAVIVQVFREITVAGNTKIELYTKTFRREGGMEYDLGTPLKETIAHAMKRLGVQPASLIMWRDGIGDAAFEDKAAEEIRGIREGLAGMSLESGDKDGCSSENVPIAYIVCQKRIATKFLVSYNNGIHGAPPGTLVSNIQGLSHETFYINGRSPFFSTAKPVRYIVVEKDNRLDAVSMPDVTWGQCHDYPNWPGPVKVPSVCQMAHKLAELAGTFADCGESMNDDELSNTVHFL